MKDAKLIITFTQLNEQELAEALKEDPEKDSADGFKVSFELDHKGYTIDDLTTDDPEQYWKQGVVMSIMDRLLSGLCGNRGTTFDTAIEDASEKMSQAIKMTKLTRLKDTVGSKLEELLEKIGGDSDEAMQELKAGSVKEGHC